jgi:hypothetical protein
MFIELMPLIEKRAITITVAALKDGHVRVNVVPAALAEDSQVNEKIGYSNKDKITKIPESAVHALTTRPILYEICSAHSLGMLNCSEPRSEGLHRWRARKHLEITMVMRDSSCSRGIAAFSAAPRALHGICQAGLSGK